MVMREGGILPAIVGTFVPYPGYRAFFRTTGYCCLQFIFLNMLKNTKLTRAIRIAMVNLAGIPSVVYGLFGLGLFVLFLNFGTSNTRMLH